MAFLLVIIVRLCYNVTRIILGYCAMTTSIDTIISGLRAMHSNAVCELDYSTPYELLVAVVLSAQCTDKRVNIVTKQLFSVANTPQAMVALPIERVKEIIHSVGCYNRKAVSIMNLSAALLEHYGGEVPQTVEELMRLDGVGRKTANVVYSVAWGGDAIAVDTHVQRVSNRIGLVDTQKVEQTELALMAAMPASEWSEVHHLLIHHGRYICKARNPDCGECLISEYCKFYNAFSASANSDNSRD